MKNYYLVHPISLERVAYKLNRPHVIFRGYDISPWSKLFGVSGRVRKT